MEVGTSRAQTAPSDLQVKTRALPSAICAHGASSTHEVDLTLAAVVTRAMSPLSWDNQAARRAPPVVTLCWTNRAALPVLLDHTPLVLPTPIAPHVSVASSRGLTSQRLAMNAHPVSTRTRLANLLAHAAFNQEGTTQHTIPWRPTREPYSVTPPLPGTTSYLRTFRQLPVRLATTRVLEPEHARYAQWAATLWERVRPVPLARPANTRMLRAKASVWTFRRAMPAPA